MSYPINLYIDASRTIFDWCNAAEKPNEKSVLDVQGQYYLIYNYASATTEDNAWSNTTQQVNTVYPAYPPGKIKLKSFVRATSTDIKSVVVETIVVDAATGNAITNGGITQLAGHSSQVYPYAGLAAQGAFMPEIAATDVAAIIYFDLPALVGNNFTNNKTYQLQFRFLGKNTSNATVGASDWFNAAHLLNVRSQAPIVTITSPNFSTVGEVNEVTVENVSELSVFFKTNIDSETRIRTDLTYPSGIANFTSSNSHLVSYSGTSHKYTIQNPDPNNTNGIRFSIAARDNLYKNINPCGWGLFNYNILFKKTNTVPAPEPDTGSPVITVTSPSLNSYHKSTIMFLSGDCEKATAIKVEVWQNGSKQSTVTANFVFNKTKWSAAASSLKNGEVKLKVIATNSTNNTTTTVWHSFYVDIEAPVIILNSVTGKNISGNTTNIPVTATTDVYGLTATINSSAEDVLSGVLRYKVYVNDIVADEINVSARQTFLAANSNITLSEGQNKIDVVYSDQLGNYDHASVAGRDYFYINSLSANADGPNINITSPLFGTLFNRKNVVINGTCTDADGIKKITLEIYKEFTETPYLNTSNVTINHATGTWSCQLPDLVEGRLVIKAFGEDNLGKVSANKATVAIIIDTILPYITIQSVNPGLITTSASSSVISYASDDGSGLARYVAKLEDRLGVIKEVANVEIFDYPNTNQNSPITTNLSLTSGRNTVHLFYYDAAGNVATTSRVITYNALDVTPPVVEITPSENTVLANLPLNFSVKAEDLESGLKSCDIDFYPLTVPQQITASSKYYRVGMLPLAMSGVDLTLPDSKVLRLFESKSNLSYVSAPAAQYFDGDFTVESWVYVYEAAAKHYLLSFGSIDGSDSVEIGLNYIGLNNTFTLKPWLRITNQSNASNVLIAPTPLQSRQWAHLAFVLSGNQVTVYLNSNVWYSETITRIPRAISMTKCYIGRGALPGESSNGYYSNCRIWNIARSANDIRENMSKGIDSASGLIASWRFNNFLNNITQDSSGNYHNATLFASEIRDVTAETRRWVLGLPKEQSQALSHIDFSGTSFNSTQGFTVEFSIVCQEKNAGGTLLLLANTAKDKMLSINLFDGDRVSFYIKNGSSVKTITSTTALPLNQKLHLAFSITANGLINIYKDGEIWGTGSGAMPEFFADIAYLCKGVVAAMSSKIVLYDFRLWNIGKTQSDIKQKMETFLLGTESGLQVYYLINDGIGGQIKDYSTKGNHGLIVGNNYEWRQAPAETSTVPYSSVLFFSIDEITSPLSQSGQEYGSLLEQDFSIDTQTINLKTSDTYDSDYVQSEHLLPGSHVVKVKAINGDNFETTVYRTLILRGGDFSVVNISPSNGETSVNPSAQLIIDFSEPVALGTMQSQINQSIIVLDSNNATVELKATSLLLSEGGKRLTCSFVNTLAANTLFKIRIVAGLLAAGGNTLKEDVTSRFTTGSSFDDGFIVVSTSPFDGQMSVAQDASLMISFSQAIAYGTAVSQINHGITVIEAGNITKATLKDSMLSLSSENTKLTCPFMQPLKSDTNYKIIISANLMSVNGTTLGKDYIYYFTTSGVTGTKTYSIPVFNGMNGLSIPLQRTQGNYNNITLRQFLQDQVGAGNVGGIYWYNYITQKWVGDLLGNSIMKTFTSQDGFFVTFNLSSSAMINFSGTIIDNGNTTINLKKGLNLIGIPLLINDINSIKALLAYISNNINQEIIVSYMCRRKKVSNNQEELFGYTYIREQNDIRNGTSFILDRLGGDAIAIVAEKDAVFTIQGQAWQD